VFGVLTLWWPGATLVVLMAFIAAYALVDGIVALLYAFRLRPIFDRWWVLLVQGLISAAFGVLAFIYPALSLAYIIFSVSLWMLFASMALFMLARAQKAMGASSRWSMLGALLSLALAVAAIAYPRLTVASVLALIAWFALVLGVVHLIVGVRVRSLAKVMTTP
jgi:uncharacterized membrane protein HdeD (DUF308 family)